MPAGPIRALRFVHAALLRETTNLAERARDLDRPEQAASLIADVRLVTEVIRGHAKGEDEGYFPALAERVPGLTEAFGIDHANEAPLLDVLDALVGEVRTEDDLATLQHKLQKLAGDVALHQYKEESLLWPATEEHFTPPEQGALLGAIIAAVPRDSMPVLVPWIVDRLSPEDAEDYTRVLHQAQPEPVFKLSVGWIRERCKPEVWTQLRRRVPALVTLAG